ncbi:hypothetical protein [Nocardioides sp.]|uniref:hypothetical protein n=1 Tax=Nocardioides sp. TaxID=35761 RepID=UPI0026294C52|nr:hypothetical protein [Nocardioides sp.]
MRLTAQGRRRITQACAAIVALVLIWAGASWWHAAHRSALVKALDLVPGDAQRISWTDWSAVMKKVGRKGGTAGILDRAYDADLSSTSAMVTSAAALDKLGLPITDLRTETFAQADDGAVVVLRVDGAQRWVARLAKAGWKKSDHGVYDGSAVAPELQLSPELTYVTTAGDLVVASDDPDYVRKVADRDMVKPVAAMTKAAEQLPSPVSAVLFSGDYTCGHLAMSQADDLDQEQARVLLSSVGGLDPLTAFAFGYSPDASHLRVAMTFDNDDVARHNAEARATLARGDAPGQGGSFRDRFTLTKAKASGTVVTLALTPKPGQSVLSDLSSGPVLFAGC